MDVISYIMKIVYSLCVWIFAIAVVTSHLTILKPLMTKSKTLPLNGTHYLHKCAPYLQPLNFGPQEYFTNQTQCLKDLISAQQQPLWDDSRVDCIAEVDKFRRGIFSYRSRKLR